MPRVPRKKSRQVVIRLTEPGYDYVEQVAKATSLTVSDVIRAMMRFASLHPTSQWLPSELGDNAGRAVDSKLAKLASDLAAQRGIQ